MDVNSRVQLAKRCTDADGVCGDDGATMSATALKGLTTAAGESAYPERTAANELPEELSQISASFGCPGLRDSPADGGRRKATRPKRAATTRKTGKHMIGATGFIDDGHPTLMASVCGSNLTRQ
jgi:hypothetical protein